MAVDTEILRRVAYTFGHANQKALVAEAADEIDRLRELCDARGNRLAYYAKALAMKESLTANEEQ